MTHPLSLRITAEAVQKSTDRISAAANDPSLEWEDVSRLAGEESRKILEMMHFADKAADHFVEQNTDQAVETALHMFNVAQTHVEPDFVPDLVEGVNVFVSRVRQQAEQGAILPMHYMDLGVRKELYLIESFLRAESAKRKAEGNL